MQNPPFKQLTIRHVYNKYNQPLAYSAVDEKGKLYFVDLIDFLIKPHKMNVWMFLPITQSELIALENNQLSTYDLVCHSSHKQCYLESEYEEQKMPNNWQSRPIASIPTNCLPAKNSFINFK